MWEICLLWFRGSYVPYFGKFCCVRCALNLRLEIIHLLVCYIRSAGWCKQIRCSISALVLHYQKKETNTWIFRLQVHSVYYCGFENESLLKVKFLYVLISMGWFLKFFLSLESVRKKNMLVTSELWNPFCHFMLPVSV